MSQTSTTFTDAKIKETYERVLQFDPTESIVRDGTGSSVNVNIGQPSDASFSDGFFDTFNSGTSVANAIDEISEAFLDLAPAKAGILTGYDLSLSSPSVFSGRIAANLESSSWYVGTAQGSGSDLLTSTTNLVLISPNTASRFRAGKNSDISASLAGGVTASRGFGDTALAVVDSRSFSDGLGTGSEGYVIIDTLETYNTFWAICNTKIEDTLSTTGSNKYKLTADAGAGSTDEYQLFYLGTYASPSFGVSPYTSSITPVVRYLSGIEYLYQGTQIEIKYQGDNCYDPVYYGTASQLASVQSSYFTTDYAGPGSTPSQGDILSVTESITLTNNVQSSYGQTGSFTATLRKPGKSNVTSNGVGIGSNAINTYATRSTALIEYFADEDKRYTNFSNSAWTPATTLSTGALQVQNGRLVNGQDFDYPGFGDINEYYRVFTPNNGNVGGTLAVTKTGFSSFVTPWNSTGSLQIAFYIASESGSNIYDMGRAVGDNSGTIYGVRDSLVGTTITFDIPNPPGTSVQANDPMILAVRYSGSSASDYLIRLTVAFNAG